MVHNDIPRNYTGTLVKLAEEIGDLKYDALAEFLDLLAQKIKTDGDKDAARGRVKLAKKLHDCSEGLEECKVSIKGAWGICLPFM